MYARDGLVLQVFLRGDFLIHDAETVTLLRCDVYRAVAAGAGVFLRRRHRTLFRNPRLNLQGEKSERRWDID